MKDGWQSRWVKSDWKKSEGKAGSFKHTAGKWPGDPDDKGLYLSLFVFFTLVRFFFRNISALGHYIISSREFSTCRAEIFYLFLSVLLL